MVGLARDADQTVGAWLPECDADGLDRAVAAAERDVRFKKLLAPSDENERRVAATHDRKSNASR